MADDAHNIIPVPARLADNDSASQRLQLTHRLLTSQDPSVQLRVFFQQLAPMLPFSGLQYHPPQRSAHESRSQRLGKIGRHQCDYQLSCGDQALGQLIFSRDQRFSEAEQQWLEEWLSVLVLPFSNALRYQEALLLAHIDSLTGIGNRAAFDSALHRELRLAERHKHELSLLVVDVDLFKRVNDRYGHSYGDDILKQVVAQLECLCRDTDLLFRYGGEEFVILLSKTDRAGARVIAERIRRGVEDAVSAGEGEDQRAITVSVVIGTRLPEGETSLHSIFDRADRALYRAKEEGRNRVIGESPAARTAASPQRALL